MAFPDDDTNNDSQGGDFLSDIQSPTPTPAQPAAPRSLGDLGARKPKPLSEEKPGFFARMAASLPAGGIPGYGGSPLPVSIPSKEQVAQEAEQRVAQKKQQEEADAFHQAAGVPVAPKQPSYWDLVGRGMITAARSESGVYIPTDEEKAQDEAKFKAEDDTNAERINDFLKQGQYLLWKLGGDEPDLPMTQEDLDQQPSEYLSRIMDDPNTTDAMKKHAIKIAIDYSREFLDKRPTLARRAWENLLDSWRNGLVGVGMAEKPMPIPTKDAISKNADYDKETDAQLSMVNRFLSDRKSDGLTDEERYNKIKDDSRFNRADVPTGIPGTMLAIPQSTSIKSILNKKDYSTDDPDTINHAIIALQAPEWNTDRTWQRQTGTSAQQFDKKDDYFQSTASLKVQQAYLKNIKGEKLTPEEQKMVDDVEKEYARRYFSYDLGKATYDFMPPARGFLEHGAAVTGQIGGMVASPETVAFLGMGGLGVRAGEAVLARVGAETAGGMLGRAALATGVRTAVSMGEMGAITAATEIPRQYGLIAQGEQKDFNTDEFLNRVKMGALLGGGLDTVLHGFQIAGRVFRGGPLVQDATPLQVNRILRQRGIDPAKATRMQQLDAYGEAIGVPPDQRAMIKADAEAAQAQRTTTPSDPTTTADGTRSEPVGEAMPQEGTVATDLETGVPDVEAPHPMETGAPVEHVPPPEPAAPPTRPATANDVASVKKRLADLEIELAEERRLNPNNPSKKEGELVELKSQLEQQARELHGGRARMEPETSPPAPPRPEETPVLKSETNVGEAGGTPLENARAELEDAHAAVRNAGSEEAFLDAQQRLHDAQMMHDAEVEAATLPKPEEQIEMTFDNTPSQGTLDTPVQPQPTAYESKLPTTEIYRRAPARQTGESYWGFRQRIEKLRDKASNDYMDARQRYEKLDEGDRLAPDFKSGRMEATETQQIANTQKGNLERWLKRMDGIEQYAARDPVVKKAQQKLNRLERKVRKATDAEKLGQAQVEAANARREFETARDKALNDRVEKLFPRQTGIPDAPNGWVSVDTAGPGEGTIQNSSGENVRPATAQDLARSCA